MPHAVSTPIRLAVLISGGGTTLQNFIDRIAEGRMAAEIAVVVSSSSKAQGLVRAERAGLETVVVRQRDFADVGSFSAAVFEECRRREVDLVAMAGFLKFVEIPADFAGRVMNIHPALLPSFGGEGYYGRRVHEAVLEHGSKISGCTVHFADNEYDHGPIILQRCVPVEEDDTPETLAARVFEQECEAYPEAIGLYAAGRLRIEEGRVRVRDEALAKMKERDKAMRAARDNILHRVGDWLCTRGFVRAGAGHFMQRSGDLVCHIGFQKLRSGRRVRVMCHITKGEDWATSIEGPRSDAYERPNSPNKIKYQFGWSTRKSDIEQCADEYCRFIKDVVLPWFKEQITKSEA